MKLANSLFCSSDTLSLSRISYLIFSSLFREFSKAVIFDMTSLIEKKD